MIRSSNGVNSNSRKGAKPGFRQNSIESFFNRSKVSSSGKTSAAASKASSINAIQVDLIQPEPKEIAKSKFEMMKASRPSLLFESQGSFDDCDPDAEFKKLIEQPTLNNFKRPVVSKVPTLHRSSSTTSQHTIQKLESGSFTSITSLTSNSGANTRQLSFTSHTEFDTTDISNNATSTQTISSVESTDSTASLKRSSFQGLNFSQQKKIKLIKREGSSLAGSSSQKTSKTSVKEIPIKLTREQETVIELIVRKRLNVFYSGSAGTGKSIILRNIIERLTSLYGKEYIAITASTGLAATTIGGVTLHRWAGIGLGNGPTEIIINRIQRKFDLFASWKNTKVLIIDEISMIDGKFLDKLEEIARRVRRNNKPFGGIQLVLTGDFFQLPPVPKKEVNEISMFCFESQMWSRSVQKTILLTRVFRQQDNELVDILNSIRFGDIEPAMVKTLKALDREIEYPDGIRPTELYATRREVDASNVRQLQLLPGETREFKSLDTAPKEYMNLLDSSMMVEKIVTLKEDAQVMMLKNRPETELVNGSLGKVLFFIPQKLQKKMNDNYRFMDQEAIADMKLVSRVISKPLYRESAEFKQDLNARPLSRIEKLETMINAAVKISPKDPCFPFVKWSIASNRFYHELMLPDTFVVDLPGNNSGLQRSQLPIMLCWALSIHKSQGQTIQRLKVDLRNIFEAGQVYVALSRAISKDNLQVVNFNPKRIRANDKVKDFYKQLETFK